MTKAQHKVQLVKHCAEAASTIHAECAGILASREDHDHQAANPETELAGCGPALVELLSRQANIVYDLYQNSLKTTDASDQAVEISPQKYDLVLKRLEDIASIAYSKFYAYLFKDLPVCWRQLYTDARILKFCLLFLKSPYATSNNESKGGSLDKKKPIALVHDQLDELIKSLDLALILAGAAGERRGRTWIDEALELLYNIWVEERRILDSDDDAAAGCDRPAKRAKLLVEHHGVPGPRDSHQSSRTFSTNEPFTPPVTHPIQKTSALSIDEFQTYMDRPRDPTLGPEPLILQNTLNEWPALTIRPWNQPSYLLSQTFDGRRLVPVEIGRSYVDEGWGQKLITFGEFVREYIDPTSSSGVARGDIVREGNNSNIKTGSKKDKCSEIPETGEPKDQQPTSPRKPTAYLAQHQLFTQLPRLRSDILVPDYCYTAPPPPPRPPSPHSTTQKEIEVVEELAAPLVNAWFGPPGTISPLHHDPYHNVLAQVVGRKYVRLYAPRETRRLAARGRDENGVDMANTSCFDVGVLEGWDERRYGDGDDGEEQENGEEGEDRYEGEEDGEEGEGERNGNRHGVEEEMFKTIPFVDCILEPGDLLYIPVGWWHYVRGLSVSFSVSFWWN
ncbi:hypothetical protein F4777DRAFT_553282 [Nemania sp. FL0916]|nr:hypothetical protein F4777DRAFT_553282 [Nemania sp. FL0916]